MSRSRTGCRRSTCSEFAPASAGWSRHGVGVNGAPAFSPDGKQLALTLSGSGGNLDIWLLDLATQQLSA